MMSFGLSATDSSLPHSATGKDWALPPTRSFSSHRRTQSQATSTSSPNLHIAKDGRSMSLSLDPESDRSPFGVYRIPQRQREETIDEEEGGKGEDDETEAGINTQQRRAAAMSRPFSLRSPPLTAPTRVSSIAVSRGVSLVPDTLHRQTGTSQRTGTTSLGPGPGPAGETSIWSVGLASNPGVGFGWVSPALGTGRSTGTAVGRVRGLTIAVLKDDSKEMVVGDIPVVTPGLANIQSEENMNSEHNSSNDERDDSKIDDKRKEIILCRYYHTPGLTCTSRPCRFVHSLEALGMKNESSSYDMKSPPPRATSSDPTSGIFAQAQAKFLDLNDIENGHVAPGEVVRLPRAEGDREVVGTVFLMSGGGKGPAGRSKAKFKTVPCKDFADGHCPYGEYCSFIHDDKGAQQAGDEKPSPRQDIKQEQSATDTSTDLKRNSITSVSAWTQALPEPIKSRTARLADERRLSLPSSTSLSVAAKPFLQSPIEVDHNGKLGPRKPPTDTFTVPKISKPPRTLTWLTRSPPGSLELDRKEKDPLQTPVSAKHLAPPFSAISLYGTESDPATPWDPALRKKKSEELKMPSVIHKEYASARFESPPTPKHHGIIPYPWGMPMSPVVQPGTKGFKGDPGVLWTPSGWAVQDAAMKLSMRSAEDKALGRPSKRRGKSYYKTRPCKFFIEGHCPRGSSCTYIHELPIPSDSSNTSDSSLPIETPTPTPTRHPHFRTIPCKFYNSAQGCHAGSTCNFLHTRVVPLSAPLVDKPRPWRTRPCRHYQVGRCTLGEACHFAHVFVKLDQEDDNNDEESGHEISSSTVRFGSMNGSEEYTSDEDDDLEIVTEDMTIHAKTGISRFY